MVDLDVTGPLDDERLIDIGQVEAWKRVMGPIIDEVAHHPLALPLPEPDKKMDGGRVLLSGIRVDLMDAADLLVSEEVLDDDVVELLEIAKTGALWGDSASDTWRRLMAISEMILAREISRAAAERVATDERR